MGAVEADTSPQILVGSLGWDLERWRTLQDEDSDLSKVKEHMVRGMLPDAAERRSLTQPAKILLRHWKRLELKNGLVQFCTRPPKH